ncbi:MAG: efflux RND transporter periplasmic adaptor subunit [Acidobacteria bacterium]|nr:efflux RND transporter periplasmic adaptor subunit [Acidobacteriota bacterium]
MKKFLLIIVVGVFLSALGFRLYQELGGGEVAAGGRPPGSGRPSGGGRPPGGGKLPMLVDTAQVETHQFETTLEVLGELKPQAEVDVMSRISGRLQQVLVNRGDPVQEGQLLAVVDDVDLRQQIIRSEAATAVARAGVNREEATYRNLLLQVKRFQDLHEEALISTQELEDLESRLFVAEAQRELAKAQVLQAEASLRELGIQQEQTRIYSPLNGFVGTRYLDPGALVSPSLSILSVLDVDRVKTIVPVVESAIQRIRIGLPAEIVVDAYPDQIYEGTVTRITPFLNPETRSADVEIEIANPDNMLKPGMFARVKIDAKISRNALSIPRSALLTRGSQKGVYLLTEDMTTVFQVIQIGQIKSNVVEVIEGLEEGVEVVNTGSSNLNEGDRVRTQ